LGFWKCPDQCNTCGHNNVMKLKKVVAVCAVLIGLGEVAQAAHVWEDAGGWWSDHFVAVPVTTPKYTGQELSLDLFGSYTASERNIEHLFETNIRGGDWGGGVGLNYFLTRYFGIGGDINMSDNGGNFVDIMDGNLFARLPLGNSGVAPYIFGGGGRSTDPIWEWFGQAGVGLEFRFNPTTGIFVDGRYMWMDVTPDRLMLRAGLRLVF
jgi:hypothetical protein